MGTGSWLLLKKQLMQWDARSMPDWKPIDQSCPVDEKKQQFIGI